MRLVRNSEAGTETDRVERVPPLARPSAWPLSADTAPFSCAAAGRLLTRRSRNLGSSNSTTAFNSRILSRVKLEERPLSWASTHLTNRAWSPSKSPRIRPNCQAKMPPAANSAANRAIPPLRNAVTAAPKAG